MNQQEFLKRIGKLQGAELGPVSTGGLPEQGGRPQHEEPEPDAPEHLVDLRAEMVRSVAEKIAGSRMDTTVAEDPRLVAAVRDMAAAAIDESDTPLSRSEREFLLERLTDEILGLGPLQPLLGDPTISEVMVNGLMTSGWRRPALSRRPACASTTRSTCAGSSTGS